MSNDFILSLDLGTSFIKGFIVDTELNITRDHSYEINTSINQEIHEQDPHKILSFIKQILDHEVSSRNVDKVTFTNAMHSTLLLDSDMEPITPSIIWSDMRASSIYEEFVKQLDPSTYYKITQIPLHPILPILKIFWFKKNDIKLWSKLKYVVSLKDWIIYKLTGDLLTDTSTAASTGFMNFESLKWDKRLTDICEIGSNQLSPIYKGTHKITYLDSSVVLGITDGPMANYFVNSIDVLSRNLVATAGTSAAVRATKKSPEKSDSNSGVFTYEIDKTTFVSGIASNNAGSVFKWSRKNLKFKYLNEQAVTPPDEQDPIFNPFIYEERAPLWGVSQSYTNIESLQFLDSKKVSLLVYESVFFNILRMIEALNTNKYVEEIVISGGVFNNYEVIQLFANVTQMKVITLDSSQLSALGSARFGLEQFGFTFENLRFNLKTVYPNVNWSKIERQRYAKFKEMIS